MKNIKGKYLYICLYIILLKYISILDTVLMKGKENGQFE